MTSSMLPKQSSEFSAASE